MAINRDSLTLKLAAALLAFVAVFLGVRALDGSSASLPGRAEVAVREGQLPGATTAQQIEGLQAQVREAPSDPDGYTQLGLAYLQQVRESGDPTFYPRAEGSFEQALRLNPNDFAAISGLGSLALARHDFRSGLALGERARRINPGVARNYGVIADAQVELGRYGAAERTLQHYVDLKPELSSYARVSYFRELHGDLSGALAAMRLAVSAGGGTAENVGYVEALVGKLHFDSGEYPAAEGAYRSALETDPGFPAAIAGLARVEAAGGEYAPAIRRLRALVQRLPLPEYVIALGEIEQAAGMTAAARRDYQLVGAETQLLQANGVNTDAELALFQADHGDPAQAVGLAARAWAAAPSVRSADAYSWALSSAGRDREALAMSAQAMRLGSGDPSFLYHAGMVALRAGEPERAKAFLSRLVEQSPRFNPHFGPRAQRTLEGLG
ncbi:MAG TPA: tetratricopeptide repeat protein [Solirubrobacterales bacterium]